MTAISAVILAGGRATRLGGIDKTALVIDGETIFARQVRVLAPRVAEILVSAQGEVPGFRTVADVVAGAGPLAGIAAGLAAARTPWLLVLAGDMPYVSAALIDRLVAPIVALASGAAPDAGELDAVGIRIGGMPEPLCCVLRVAAARPVVERRLAERRLKASTLLTAGELRVAWLDESALRADDPELRALHNVNEPGDLPPSAM